MITMLMRSNISLSASVRSLNDNNLTTLPRELFERMNVLRTVRLANNPFLCDCRLSWLGRWLRRHPTLALFTKCYAPPTLRGKEVAELHDSNFRCPGQSAAKFAGLLWFLLSFLCHSSAYAIKHLN